ncbi:hypothetical protein [Chryseobacterium tongliaoense]|uniref:hypothetical protein n=1 Tax=Chryseobacterium tongliaoense TaxID=3240933 RepID=UPI003515615A
MKFFLLLFYLFLCVSCAEKDDANEYFYNLTQELSPIYKEPGKIKAIQKREFAKFKTTKDEKYLISSRYAEFFLKEHNDSKQVPVVFELLKLNNDRYTFISMICNFNLALELENTSPKLAMQFLDNSIKFDRELNKTYYLTHLYHAKGRFYYNDKNYSKAMYYFRQALKNFTPDQKLYIASMHNNFGLTYAQLKKPDLALEETKKGIKILESKKNPNKEETEFLNSMKDNLGWYFYQLKDDKNAEKFLIQQFDYYKDRKEYNHLSIQTARKLFVIYAQTGQNDQQKKIIDYLLNIEPQLHNITDKISLYEILQSYYTGNNNLRELKITSIKLTELYHVFNDENKQNIQEISDNLNTLIIKNIDNKYEYDIRFQKKQKLWLASLAILCIIILTIIIFNIRIKIKNEKKITQKQKELFQSNEKILEQDKNLQKEIIKNLHRTLSLKIDAENILLESLKKTKNKQNADTEQLLKDLLLKVNNLILIDKRSYNSFNESVMENKLFVERLSNRCTGLTNKELKLCTYFVMNLSSKEIAALENTTTGTIRVYKTKIKSKLGLIKDDDLSAFLNSI